MQFGVGGFSTDKNIKAHWRIDTPGTAPLPVRGDRITLVAMGETYAVMTATALPGGAMGNTANITAVRE